LKQPAGRCRHKGRSLGELLIGFAPIARADATRLVLGSMPSRLSLEHQQYYGNPRNAFWGMCAQALGFDANEPYVERSAALIDARIAVWDVLYACVRRTSLDSDIEEDSVVANDFATLLNRCPSLQAIYFNGAAAERLFRRYVSPTLGEQLQSMTMLRLPSTSPANAALNFDAKCARWAAVFENVCDES
jgi:TDG/mug DNA glycosylase family protein